MIPYSKYLNQEIESVKTTLTFLILPMVIKLLLIMYHVLWYTSRLIILSIICGFLIITGPVSLPLLAWFAYQKQYPIEGE